MEFIIVTGMSGAGKSCVIDSMEDLGFFCVDNIPANLIPVFAQLLKDSSEHSRIAVVTDIRDEAAFPDFVKSLSTLKEFEISYKTMFIDASDDVLNKRYKETRRRHPLQKNQSESTYLAIKRERELIGPAKEIADYILDTSNLSAIQCRVRVMGMFSGEESGKLHVHCMSFGFKHGTPHDADFVFDVRFLPNPFYIPELKSLTGLDSAVSDYVMQFEQSQKYAQMICDMMELACTLSKQEGRTQLVVAIGCTGGHHRSVTFAELLCKRLNELGQSASVSHRDILK